jgi:hypothetical protein
VRHQHTGPDEPPTHAVCVPGARDPHTTRPVVLLPLNANHLFVLCEIFHPGADEIRRPVQS